MSRAHFLQMDGSSFDMAASVRMLRYKSWPSPWIVFGRDLRQADTAFHRMSVRRLIQPVACCLGYHSWLFTFPCPSTPHHHLPCLHHRGPLSPRSGSCPSSQSQCTLKPPHSPTKQRGSSSSASLAHAQTLASAWPSRQTQHQSRSLASSHSRSRMATGGEDGP